MLSNPPYGKSWKSDLDRMGGKKEIKDPRFVIQRDDDPEYSLLTRSGDGQMLFLANMLSKMKHDTPLGSRIAEIHNGSSLFAANREFSGGTTLIVIVYSPKQIPMLIR
jgi:type I restriction enzyme M protein